MQYDSEHAFWKVPHTMASANIKADILKLCPKGNVYEEHENFIKTFDPKLRSDENIVLILCAITLFCPDRQNIIHPDVIKLEQVKSLALSENRNCYRVFFLEFILFFASTLSGEYL
jgi:nuclear receptor subfamily 1 group I